MEFELTDFEYDEYSKDMSLMYDHEDISFEQEYLIKTTVEREHKRLNEVFKNEYNNYINKGQYFYGCPFDMYSSTYQERLQQFINDGKDELYFIENEFKQGIEFYRFSQFLNNDFKGKFETALRQRKKFLIDRLNNLGYSINIIDSKKQNAIFEISEQHKQNNEPTFDKYCRVGALFAQDFIYRKTIKNIPSYFYKDQSFKSAYKLSEYIKHEVLKTESSISQYINDVLNESNSRKNFFLHIDMMEQIIEYCNYYKLQISDSFMSKFNELKKLH